MTELAQELTLEQKLALIDEAIAKAEGNTEVETRLINEIVDPQDVLQCDSCQ